LKLPASVG